MSFVHINRGEDKPHMWMTYEEFAKKYPKLAKRAARKISKTCMGYRLKQKRLEHKITLRKMSLLSGIDIITIQDVEHGITPLTKNFEQKYMAALSR